MKKMIVTSIVSVASLIMFASVSLAIDTVPLPDKPLPIYKTVKTAPIGQKMIGTWPTPEKPKTSVINSKKRTGRKRPVRNTRRAPRRPGR